MYEHEKTSRALTSRSLPLGLPLPCSHPLWPKLTRWTEIWKKREWEIKSFFFHCNRCQLKIYAFDGGFLMKKIQRTLIGCAGASVWKLQCGRQHSLLKWNYIDFNYKSIAIQLNRPPSHFHHCNRNALFGKPTNNNRNEKSGCNKVYIATALKLLREQ